MAFIRLYATHNFRVATGNRRVWIVFGRLRVGNRRVADVIGQLRLRFVGVCHDSVTLRFVN